jgi:hypothetical protein
MKIITMILFLFFSTALGYSSEAVLKYKSYLTVQKVESSAKKSLISKYLIQYPGVKIYNPVISPPPFRDVIDTIYRQKSCKANSFEFNLFINKSLFEMPLIQKKIKEAMKSKGFNIYRSNEFGVGLWKNKQGELLVNFVTKLTPFTYVNSVCKV